MLHRLLCAGCCEVTGQPARKSALQRVSRVPYGIRNFRTFSTQLKSTVVCDRHVAREAIMEYWGTHNYCASLPPPYACSTNTAHLRV